MDLRVPREPDGWLLGGARADVALVNAFLHHLSVRNFAVATRRAYAYDLLNFLRFPAERHLGLGGVQPVDLFDHPDWQSTAMPSAGRVVVSLSERRGAAPATMNRGIAALRGLFEYAVVTGERRPARCLPRAARAGCVRAAAGCPGIWVLVVRVAAVGWCMPRGGWPESLAAGEVAAFVADLLAARDRPMALAMLLGGLRAGEVRGLRLVDVDQGLRRLRVMGKGGKERVAPVKRGVLQRLRAMRGPSGRRGARHWSASWCFVVLRGPTAGQPLTEAGLRRIFRTHRERSGAARVRPHRLRPTYGTELAAAGIDPLVQVEGGRDLSVELFEPGLQGQHVSGGFRHDAGRDVLSGERPTCCVRVAATARSASWAKPRTRRARSQPLCPTRRSRSGGA